MIHATEYDIHQWTWGNFDRALWFSGTLFNCIALTLSSLLLHHVCVFVCTSGGSMVLSGISCFFLWFGTSESMMIFMLCLYNGLSISAWNSLDVVTTESFPTVRRWGDNQYGWLFCLVYNFTCNGQAWPLKHRSDSVNLCVFFSLFMSNLSAFSLSRGTGFGFCNALCKLAAVLGNLIFGSLVGITKAIPILMASSVLVGGGLVGLRLPDTRANVLM